MVVVAQAMESETKSRPNGGVVHMEQQRDKTSVAVVILNFNGEEHLRRFLPSVVEHTPDSVDIVVADNGSTDGSCEAIEAAFSPRVKLLALDRNYGFAEGYNRALGELQHDIFILLNSDVEVTAHYVEPLILPLIESLATDGNLAVVGAKLRSLTEPEKFEYAGAAGGYIDYLGYPFCRGRLLSTVEKDCGQYDDARDLFWVSGAAFACRGDLFRRAGGFDSDFFAHMEEIDLCWRLQIMGYRIRIEPQSVVYHLGGGTLNVDSPRKTMLNHRNNLAMLFKCAPPMQRVTVALLRPPLDMLAALSYLVQGRWQSALAVGQAWWEFIRWHSVLAKKRKAIRSAKVTESMHIYKGSILLRKLFTGR